MRTCVRIRRLFEADRYLARKFDRIARKLASHDEASVAILSTIRQLMKPLDPKRRGIGFTADSMVRSVLRRQMVTIPTRAADTSLKAAGTCFCSFR